MSTKELPADDWRIAVYGTVRITGSSDRRGPRQADRRRVTAQQAGKCLYCELPIGVEIWRDGQGKRSAGVVKLRPHWDHFVPYSYTLRNAASNWALACHICNSIKTARMFETVEEARNAILPRRIAKGYEAPEVVLHRLRLHDTVDFELGVRAPTVMQVAVLRLVAKGMRYSEIARELKMSDASVGNYVAGARRALRAGSRQEAVDLARHYGFLETPVEPTPEPEPVATAPAPAAVPTPVAPAPRKPATPRKLPPKPRSGKCRTCGHSPAEVERLRKFIVTLEERLTRAEARTTPGSAA